MKTQENPGQKLQLLSRLDLLLTMTHRNARLTAVLRVHHVPAATLLFVATLFGGCAARSDVVAAGPRQASVPGPVLVAAPPSPQLAADPIADLITASNRHFETGQSELLLGHLDSARTEFNRAVDVLLDSAWGARSEPRIREHYDRLVERIRARFDAEPNARTELTTLQDNGVPPDAIAGAAAALVDQGFLKLTDNGSLVRTPPERIRRRTA